MLISLWKSILHIGYSSELRGIEKMRVMLLNGVGAFVILLLGIYGVVLWYFGVNSLYIYLPFPIILTAFFLNGKKKYDAARVVVIFGCTVAFTVIAIWIRRTGVEFALMVTACSAPLLFRRVAVSYIAMSASAICYAYYQYYDRSNPFTPGIIHQYPIFETVNLYLSVGIVFFEMLVFRDLTRHYSSKLYKKNAELDGSMMLQHEFEHRLKARNEELSVLNAKLDSQMQAKSKELRAYIEAININIILSITDENGLILSVNDKFCKISGYSRSELIGADHKILNSNFHRKVFFEHLYETVTQGNSWQGKIRNKAKDGSYYWVDMVILPIHDKCGKIEKYLSLQQNITDLKNAEQKRNAYTRALEDIAFHTSHEIRRPLANILGLIHIIEEDSVQPGELQAVAKGLKQSMEELDQATTGLYKFIHGHK